MSTIDLARGAARAAARVRADLGVGPAEGVCPFDIAEGLEVPVRIVAVPSLEGMYSPEPKPTIIVNVERPPGRRPRGELSGDFPVKFLRIGEAGHTGAPRSATGREPRAFGARPCGSSRPASARPVRWASGRSSRFTTRNFPASLRTCVRRD